MSLVICPECKREISDQANACPHCGFPMSTDLPTNNIEESMAAKKPSKSKKYIIISIAILGIIAICMYVIRPIILKKRILEEAQYGSSLKASEMAKDYYAVYGYNIEISKAIIDSLTNDISYLESTLPKVNSNDIAIKDVKYTGDKVTFTIKNNSDYTVSYVKFDIYLYDKNKNIVDTDWTNWSGSLLSKGSAVVDTYVNDDVGANSISISVDEVRNK